MVLGDWKRAREDGRLERSVERAEKASGDDDGGGGAEELDECADCLKAAAPMLYAVFDEYCLMGADDCEGIFSISKKGFSMMVEDLKFDLKDSKTCRLSDLDTLFIEVNNASQRLAKDLAPNARIAILEFRPDGGWVQKWSGHATPVEEIRKEMTAAGYALTEQPTLLDRQSFLIFERQRAPSKGPPPGSVDPVVE